MRKIVLSMMVAGIAGLAAGDGFNTSWGDGWRVSAGGALNAGLRAKGGLRSDGAWTRAVSGGRAGARPSQGMTRAEAQAQGDAYDNVGSEKVVFPNGGFIDPEDTGDHPGETWNWNIPAGALDGNGVMSISTPYSEGTSSESFRNVSGRDGDCAAGVSVGLDREIGRWGLFGLDLGLGLSYFRNDNFFKMGGTAYSRSASGASGAYVTDVSFNSDVVGDPWAQHADGSYGAGTKEGPGPTINFNGGDVTVTHRWEDGGSTSDSSSFALRARGDYEEVVLLLAAKPWFDVTDWFRVQGTLGAAVSRAHVKMDVWGHGAGASYADRQRFDDWSVCGVAGLGGMFRWKDACLGVDVLARFLDDDMELRGRNVRGSLDRGDLTVCVYLGYEF